MILIMSELCINEDQMEMRVSNNAVFKESEGRSFIRKLNLQNEYFFSVSVSNRRFKMDMFYRKCFKLCCFEESEGRNCIRKLKIYKLSISV